ncbi:MAG TPA: Stk1 family PASTA domain-containing Ser/Thr kinase [Lachnospiraceae bacterium]|nr:Stk1 family PASTA domain-containing Ser/Thr kinase [Lachnospiraceae bacterium]
MISLGMKISERYEIIDKVGSGGMADVYKAKDHRLNRFVAIKILKQEYSNDAKYVTKFRVEAQSVAGLSHPNIVNVYDVGDDDGLSYIVMELVEGITLKKFIEKKGRLDIKEAVGIGIQIAQGIEVAHENHIIHRDIKPQNIIISKEGKVKVTDFGIAKAATSNTITSNAMGSVHYISPEQARGGYSDEKSDIYSLGVTMYEMLSGRVPFEGESTVTVALAHIQDEAATLNETEPDIPHSLSRIVQKCMQKKPDMRYMSVAALIADLKRSLAEPDGSYVMFMEDNSDSPTIMLSDSELGNIKEATKVMPEVTREEEIPDEDTIDPKLEKILKICSVVVAIIIIIVVFLIIGKVSGWWGKKPVQTKATSAPEATSSAVPSAEPASNLIEVPEIVGYSLADAEDMLEKADLKYRLEPVESNEKANQVTDQKPEAREQVEKYTIVTVYYSQGKENYITIPNFVNSSVDRVMTALINLDLTVAGQDEMYSESVDAGLVCGTYPVVGSAVKKGTAVTIHVSKGPERKTTKVPYIVGKEVSVALARLEERGLKGNTEDVTYIYSDRYPEGIVVTQSIARGTEVEAGTVIDYAVSLGPKDTVSEPEPEPTTNTEPEPEPTEDVSYSYVGSVTIAGNPFDFPEDTGRIKLVLRQDGREKTVWNGTLSYDDFPMKFEFEGWSENDGTITLYKDDEATGNSYSVEFEKVIE